MVLFGSSCTAAGSERTGLCASVDQRGADALAHVCSAGAISVATNPADQPQSWFDADGNTWQGFNVDVANEIAARLGVTARFASIPTGADGTASAAIGTDEMNVTSRKITRQGRLDTVFTPPYYYIPASIAVSDGETSIQDLSTDLDGKRICVASGSTYASYLDGTLHLPSVAPKFAFLVDGADIVRFPTDEDALAALARGSMGCDAAMTGLPTIARSIQAGQRLKVVGDPLFYEPLGIGFAKSDSSEERTLVAAVSGIVQDMHDDGTLTALSVKWFGMDLTTGRPPS